MCRILIAELYLNLKMSRKVPPSVVMHAEKFKKRLNVVQCEVCEQYCGKNFTRHKQARCNHGCASATGRVFVEDEGGLIVLIPLTAKRAATGPAGFVAT